MQHHERHGDPYRETLEVPTRRSDVVFTDDSGNEWHLYKVKFVCPFDTDDPCQRCYRPTVPQGADVA